MYGIMASRASLDESFLPSATVLPGPAKEALRVGSNTSTNEQSMVRPKVVKDTKAVIIDIGTGSCKIGYAGELKPLFVVSSTVGKPLREAWNTGGNQKQYFIGKQKDMFSDISQKLVNPLRHGVIEDWDCIEAILEYLFVQEMKIQPDEHAVLLSDPPRSPITKREKYTEMMFETFNIPAFHIAHQSTLSMYSYGKTSSLVVESGHGASYVVPIVEGKILPDIIGKVNYAGADVTRFLLSVLNQTRYQFQEEHLAAIEDMKNKYCYVSRDLTEDMRIPKRKYQVEYTLPDGKRITIGKERFMCPEVLFRPSLIESSQPGLHHLTMTCINNCNTSFKKTMLNNILLCGGTTMLEGFPERFQKELDNLLGHQKPCVLACPERKFSVWRGGSILASLDSFQQRWLHRKEYEEHGTFIIYRQSF
ncbi:actin-like protein 7A [Dendropsophus ebraccatus]|uniref:actin-like protein 7A n=1 Tax=Dendropsophus ebraccatus TaxID=150705 RepID=UPI0038312E0F